MFRPLTTAPAPAAAAAAAVEEEEEEVVVVVVAAAAEEEVVVVEVVEARPLRDHLVPAVSRRTVRVPRAPGLRSARQPPPLPPVQPGQAGRPLPLRRLHRRQPACQPRSHCYPAAMLFLMRFCSSTRPHRPVFPSLPEFPSFPAFLGLPVVLLQPRYPEPEAPQPAGQPVAQMAATGSKQLVESRNPRG